MKLKGLLIQDTENEIKVRKTVAKRASEVLDVICSECGSYVIIKDATLIRKCKYICKECKDNIMASIKRSCSDEVGPE